MRLRLPWRKRSQWVDVTLRWDLVELGTARIPSSWLGKHDSLFIRLEPNLEHRLDPEALRWNDYHPFVQATLLQVELRRARD